MSFWGTALKFVAPALSFLGGERRNSAQSRAAQTQMQFQENLSNTAYQRVRADMRAAGLNPVLAAKYGGASTPGGAMPQLLDTATPAINTGLQFAKTQADVTLQNANTKLTEAKTTLSENLIPGSEAVSIISTNIAELLGSLDDLLKNYVPSYDAAVKEIETTVKQLIEKGKNSGNSVINIYNDVKGVIGDKVDQFEDWFDEQKEKRNQFKPPR